jgi:hypothetical protein
MVRGWPHFPRKCGTISGNFRLLPTGEGTVAQTKKVTVVRAGGGASVQVDLIPGETADQVITTALPHLGLAAQGTYRLLGPAESQLTGDVYQAVKDGDKLTVAQTEIGGVVCDERRALSE